MGLMQGKVAIVTGAARGQGESEARLLVSEGARVLLTDILVDEGEAVARDIGDQARFIRHDVSSESGWKAVVEYAIDSFGEIDVLVNNAAIAPVAGLLDTDIELFENVFRVNQLGIYLGMRAVVDAMSRTNGGSIINIASLAGMRGMSKMFAYSATKWAVRGMTRSAARELARYGIRVNAICPGFIETAMSDGAADAFVRSIPMRRAGSPHEIAAAVLFLASDGSSFVSGAEIVVDGGAIA